MAPLPPTAPAPSAQLADEKAALAAVHRRRMLELDALRRQLEKRAEDLEGAAASIASDRAALKAEYSAKIQELTAAKGRLEAQVRESVGVRAGSGGARVRGRRE